MEPGHLTIGNRHTATGFNGNRSDLAVPLCSGRDRMDMVVYHLIHEHFSLLLQNTSLDRIPGDSPIRPKALKYARAVKLVNSENLLSAPDRSFRQG